jgi:hypothetical protein
MVSIKSQMVDNSASRSLLSIEVIHHSQPSSPVSTPLPLPKPRFYEDSVSSNLSSPTLPPHRANPAEPFLHPAPYQHEYSSQTHLLPTEPSPLANPPLYRSIAIPFPSYTPRWSKYNDLEGGGDGLKRQGTWTSLRRTNTFTRRYPKLPKYGWQIWTVVAIVTILTVASIAIAVVKTSNGPSSASS